MIFPSSRRHTLAELMRVPNLLTAFADVLAGYALVGGGSPLQLMLLGGASMALYAAGVTHNDVCDWLRDGTLRPERPIPSGRILRHDARMFASALALIGLGLAHAVGGSSFRIGLTTLFWVFVYNRWARRIRVGGAAAIALCRVFNLYLGMSANPEMAETYASVGWVPFFYVFGITMLSLGENRGLLTSQIRWSLVSVGMAWVTLTWLLVRWALPTSGFALTFAALWGLWFLPSYGAALFYRDPPRVMKAVGRGVLGLILVDSALAAACAGVEYGMMVACLLPLAWLLARRYAVS